MIDGTHSSRPLARLATLLLLGLCFAFWPLAGYAAAVLGTASADGVDGTAQLGLAVTKSANPTQAAEGVTIVYTYRITNTGSVALTSITANDNQLNAVPGLAGPLAPSATRTAILTYTVLASDPAGPLVNTVTVTGTSPNSGTVIGNASATVLIIDPTALPGTEQPNQPRRQMFLPIIEP